MDQLRERTDKFAVAKAFEFGTIRFASSGDAKEIGLDIRLTTLNTNKVSLDQQGWQSLLDKIESMGYRIAQTEWHHASFDPNDPAGPQSVVTFVIDLARDQPASRISIRGKLDVVWSQPAGDRGDQLRTDKFTVAKAFEFDTIHFASSGDAKKIGLDIRLTALNTNKASLDPQGWQSLLDKIESLGWW